MSLAAFFAGLTIKPQTKTDRWLKYLLMVHGVFFISCLIMPMLGIFKADSPAWIGVAVLEFGGSIFALSVFCLFCIFLIAGNEIRLFFARRLLPKGSYGISDADLARGPDKSTVRKRHKSWEYYFSDTHRYSPAHCMISFSKGNTSPSGAGSSS